MKGTAVVILLRWVYRLPSGLKQGLAQLIFVASGLFARSSKRVIARNLKLCFPAESEAARRALLRANLKHNALLAMEFPTAWLGNRAEIEASLVAVDGKSYLDEPLRANRPVIVAVPHLGNWELFWHWLQLNYPALSMYSPAKLEAMDHLLLKARRQFGGKPQATDPRGLLALLKGLKQGSVMMILPDQAPRRGAGTYAPFFEQSAYTMALLHKMLQKSGAQLLFGTCLRSGQFNRFQIDLARAQFDPRTDQVDAFNLALNAQIESIIRANPEQYQWSYKRFKRQPHGVRFYD